MVKRKVLDQDVSKVLILAASHLHKDESEKFRHALDYFNAKELPFWVSQGDAQFWLDNEHFNEAKKVRKELFNLE